MTSTGRFARSATRGPDASLPGRQPHHYSIEGVPEFRAAALAWIEQAEATPGAVITSRLSRLECRVRPLREGNKERLAQFEGFFAREGLELAEITADVIETATALRAVHGFRPPDAIHLATAILTKVDVFLTGDGSLARCPGLKVEILAGPRAVS